MSPITRPAVLVCVLLLCGMAPRQEQLVELRSPDGKTVLVAGVLDRTSGNCGYSLSHDGRTILRPSAFALTFRDEPAVWRAPSRRRRDAISLGRTVEPRVRRTTRRPRLLQPGGALALGDAASAPRRRDDVSRLQRRRGVPVRRPAFRGPQRIRLAGGAQPFRVRAGLSGLGRVHRAGTVRETSPSRRRATIANGRWWWRWAPACTSPSARRSSSISRA